jgi:hypothetical protein
MDRLEAMTILLAAVDTGSLSGASRHLRIPLATVSRRVAELEEHLKVRLLHRGHRKVVLTDAQGVFFAARYSADCTTNMAGFDFRQAQGLHARMEGSASLTPNQPEDSISG